MKVGEDERDVAVGSMIFIPSNTEHGIVNTGTETLTYISAATPGFPCHRDVRRRPDLPFALRPARDRADG